MVEVAQVPLYITVLWDARCRGTSNVSNEEQPGSLRSDRGVFPVLSSGCRTATEHGPELRVVGPRLKPLRGFRVVQSVNNGVLADHFRNCTRTATVSSADLGIWNF